MTSETQVAVARHDSGVDADPELSRMVPVWNGILHEFRNHLTVLLAAANEIRVAAPKTGAAEISDALAETEWNVHRLNALVGFVDAAIRDGTAVIADLDDVVERALHLAAPTLGRTTVSLHKERRTGVTNRGSALESLLAALLVDLVGADQKPPRPESARSAGSSRQATGPSRQAAPDRYPRRGHAWRAPAVDRERRPATVAGLLALRPLRRPRRPDRGDGLHPAGHGRLFGALLIGHQPGQPSPLPLGRGGLARHFLSSGKSRPGGASCYSAAMVPRPRASLCAYGWRRRSGRRLRPS